MCMLGTHFAETEILNKKLIMASRENAEFDVDNSLNRTDLPVQTDMNQSESSNSRNLRLWSSDRPNQVPKMSVDSAVAEQKGLLSHGVAHQHRHDYDQEEMKDLEELMSNLNPLAQDYEPPKVANDVRPVLQNSAPHFAYVADRKAWVPTKTRVAGGGNPATQRPVLQNSAPHFAYVTDRKAWVPAKTHVAGGGNPVTQIGSSHGNGKANNRTIMEQIKRTVFIPNVDSQVTEQQLADLFINCGQIVEIRVCGDPRSILRLAFIEFTDEEGARNALTLTGTMLRCKPIKVLPSKTAIAPVNPTFLPRSEDERERCARTVYCTNIDTKVPRNDFRNFFESYCGEVLCMRVLGDDHHPTRIAFVEFVMVESAMAALNCSGVIMGSLQIRISPSKTPVKPRRSARKGSRPSFYLQGRSSE